MARELLSPHAVEQGLVALRQAFQALAYIRTSLPGGKFVQNPEIPYLLSESWIAQEIASGVTPFWPSPPSVMRGGKDADLLVLDGTAKVTVEVKATGSAGFQNLSAKDLDADVLVWLDFSRYFETSQAAPPNAYWLKQPRKSSLKSGKITLAGFKRQCGDRLIVQRLAPIAQVEGPASATRLVARP